MTHADIIDRLGGIRKLAHQLGHSRHTTVQGWRDRDAIPVKHWTDLLAVARLVGEPLEPHDFLPVGMKDDALTASAASKSPGKSSGLTAAQQSEAA